MHPSAWFIFAVFPLYFISWARYYRVKLVLWTVACGLVFLGLYGLWFSQGASGIVTGIVFAIGVGVMFMYYYGIIGHPFDRLPERHLPPARIE